MKYLVVGTDFTFGYKKSGNVELLKKISGDYGFELKIIETSPEKIINSIIILSIFPSLA